MTLSATDPDPAYPISRTCCGTSEAAEHTPWCRQQFVPLRRLCCETLREEAHKDGCRAPMFAEMFRSADADRDAAFQQAISESGQRIAEAAERDRATGPFGGREAGLDWEQQDAAEPVRNWGRPNWGHLDTCSLLKPLTRSTLDFCTCGQEPARQARAAATEAEQQAEALGRRAGVLLRQPGVLAAVLRDIYLQRDKARLAEAESVWAKQNPGLAALFGVLDS